ncbi:Cofactor-independent phosphoglycerate mutase [Arabidopsis thaliana]|uniref:Cofactor-independent phosphoglycerate mutase n=1 Tax=Arabidopsis thaliana TaxID=3702 RepID=F4JK17_ARATH|nr:Cofactor-independent phosphoglycerate mutase [Arabidopsis thaliana]AEE82761.1 Cofactor-independent phosphoglycerate mutase [Arabidopsis thaliana]|eukprot:NP_192690.3 Cofactor-independent phosphoglycerate mutase [Arabidopsis thaliana]
MEEVQKRVAFILIDGLGDVSIPRLGYKTPLQAAEIPNLDAIASAGINGLMDPVEVGLGCGSDTAHLSLMGYDPRVYYRGRGAFESMGAGLAMSPGDIAFKSNFATLDEDSGVVVSRRADRHFEEEGPILCAALDGMKLPSFPEYEVRVRYATEHRCGVVVKGPKLSGNISGTDPLKDNRLLLEAKPLDESEEANHTAKVVNELSREISRILVSHPVNVKRAAQGKNIANLVLLRGCGIRIEVPPFHEKHGLWPCMVAPTKIIAGLGMSLGIDILEALGATGDYRTLLTSKAIAIANALSAPLNPCPNVFEPAEDGHKPGRSDGYDFGFLHIKAIDDAGHDKATLFKVRGLEAVDKAIRQLAKLLWQAESSSNYQYFLCVTGDHSTPVEYGDHSFEPVPFTMCRLKDFVRAVGGESALLETSLDPFPLPTDIASSENVIGKEEEDCGRREASLAISGDSVSELNEIAAARRCLGRFHGGEMMGVITKFLKLDV